MRHRVSNSWGAVISNIQKYKYSLRHNNNKNNKTPRNPFFQLNYRIWIRRFSRQVGCRADRRREGRILSVALINATHISPFEKCHIPVIRPRASYKPRAIFFSSVGMKSEQKNQILVGGKNAKKSMAEGTKKKKPSNPRMRRELGIAAAYSSHKEIFYRVRPKRRVNEIVPRLKIDFFSSFFFVHERRKQHGGKSKVRTNADGIRCVIPPRKNRRRRESNGEVN